jgi:hypothetical protein
MGKRKLVELTLEKKKKFWLVSAREKVAGS